MAKKEKIAILGGGCGAMAAAWALTDAAGWQDRYEVTVYQMGWRLGGKGAAGRDMTKGARIEEHGFHIWLGFYNNAFSMIRQVYEELARPPEAALATWDQAFQRHNYVVLEEKVDGQWVNWPMPFPENREVPGDPGIPNLFELFRRLLRLTIAGIEQEQLWAETPAKGALILPFWVQEALKVFGDISHLVGDLASDAVLGLLRLALWLAEKLDVINPITQKLFEWLLKTFKALAFKVLEPLIDKSTEARRFWILLDISTSAMLGMVLDGVITHGFDAIDEMDFIDWLVKNGLTEFSTTSAPIRAAYDLTFGFPLGDTDNPRFAAGSGLYGLLLLVLGYKGSVMWKMLGGMGDTIFGPLYEVLKKRGVTFKFFHKITDLTPAKGENAVETITVEEQAALRPEVAEYEPFLHVRNLPVWPNQPRWELLQDGERLQKAGVNFESAWCKEPPVAIHTLKRGVDFDHVVLGTSLGPLRYIARPLMDRSQPFREMVERLQTVETQGIQLWLRPTSKNLGWTQTPPVIGSYVEPLDTYADLTELLQYEDWASTDLQPQTLIYLTGPLTCPALPPLEDPTYPEKKLALVKEITRRWLENDSAHFWPKATSPEDPQGLRWSHLVAPEGSEGLERLEFQYFRANVDPNERYVLTLPGTNKYRLPSGRSGFSNLYLAGDWTRTPFNSGCVECAVISGLMASQALSGWPTTIIQDEILK